jgi:hypothetical protein
MWSHIAEPIAEPKAAAGRGRFFAWRVAQPRGLALLLVAATALVALPARAKDPGQDTADRLMQAMGGKARFDADRFLTFRFVVERDGKEVASYDHAWDRFTGRYRLDGLKDGKPLRVLFNVNDRKGRVWLDGTELAPDAAKPYLDMAYERFINDSYWLLMPWKWLDPGVTLHDEAPHVVNGETCDVVSLTFGSVGLTPKDCYWAFVSQKDGLIKQWEFLLQKEDGSPGTGEHTTFTWEDWRDAGDGLLFSRKRVKVGPGPELAILFPEVKISSTVDESVLSPPPPSAAR